MMSPYPSWPGLSGPPMNTEADGDARRLRAPTSVSPRMVGPNKSGHDVLLGTGKSDVIQ